MAISRLHIFILLGLALAPLVWLDNRTAEGPMDAPPATRAQLSLAGSPQTTSDNAPAGEDVKSLGNPLASINKNNLQEMVTRPLFAPSRHRPAVTAVVTHHESVTATVPQRDQFDLVGVLQDSERAFALLRDRNGGASFRVERGDMISGWRVVKIEAASVVLERKTGEIETLPLFAK